MQRTFLSNLSLLMLLNLLVKPVYLLLIEAEVQNRVGSEVFGHYSALLSLSFLFNIFLDLGINTFTSRELSRRGVNAGDYLSGVVLLRLLLALLYFILLGVFAFLLGYSTDSMILLAWVGINQLLAASILYIRSNLSGLLQFKRDAILSVMDRGIVLLLLGGVLYGGATDHFEIQWLIGAQTIAYLIALLTGIFFIRRYTGRMKLRWRPRLNRVVLNQSIPYALLVLLMMVYYKTDSVMLERMLPDGAWQAGIYAMGYRLFEAANMMGYLLATLLLPLFAKTLKSGESVNDLTSNAFRLVVFGGILIALLSFFWPEELLGLIYDHDIAATAPSFVLLMFAFVFMMLSYVWGTLLTANGNMRTMNRIAAGAVLLNIALNLWLIPKYGAHGSAGASLATQILVAVSQMVLCHRLLRTSPSLLIWGRVALYIGIVATTGYLLTGTSLVFITQLFIFIAVSILTAFAIRLIRMVQLQSLLRKSQ